jgi:hypothetical protein
MSKKRHRGRRSRRPSGTHRPSHLRVRPPAPPGLFSRCRPDDPDSSVSGVPRAPTTRPEIPGTARQHCASRRVDCGFRLASGGVEPSAPRAPFPGRMERKFGARISERTLPTPVSGSRFGTCPHLDLGGASALVGGESSAYSPVNWQEKQAGPLPTRSWQCSTQGRACLRLVLPTRACVMARR